MSRYRSHRAGDALVSLLESEPDRRHVPSAGDVEEAARKAAEVEAKHEIVTLEGDKLRIHEENFARFQRLSDGKAPTLVVSLLGDTSAGKSHTIRSLMQEYEFRPYCQDAAAQARATTYNVNLFPCTSIAEGVVLNFVDYEGENGSDIPAMARARLGSPGPGDMGSPPRGAAAAGASPPPSPGGAAWAAEWTSESRHRSVQSYFPRLAYTTSDVVMVVSREPFYNRRYLERCVEFAKRANAGVTNVERPVLILVGNKLPGEECETSIKGASEQFFNAWGADAKILDSFFSTVMCMYIPHRESLWRDPRSGKVVDGSELFEHQINMLRRILSVLARRKVDPPSTGGPAERQLTQQQGLWFALLPRVVAELNAGRGVDVTRLIDAAWASAMALTAQREERELDAMRAFLTFLRPARALSEVLSTVSPAPGERALGFAADFLLRFEEFRHLSLRVAARVVATRLRSLDPRLLVGGRARRYATATLRGVDHLLLGVAPCWALYPCAARGTEPADGSTDPIRCLEEGRVHGPVHRTSRPVVGGRGLWGLLSFLSHNDSWDGSFHPPPLGASDLAAWVREALALVSARGGPADEARDTPFLARLVDLAEAHASARVGVGFCPLASPPLPSPVAPGAVSAPGLPYGGAPWLLPPASPLDHSVHKALHFLPFATCKPSMPYCIGCGVKVPPPTAHDFAGGEESPPPSLPPVADAAAAGGPDAAASSISSVLGTMGALVGSWVFRDDAPTGPSSAPVEAADAGAGHDDAPVPGWSWDEVTGAPAEVDTADFDASEGEGPGAPAASPASDGDEWIPTVEEEEAARAAEAAFAESHLSVSAPDARSSSPARSPAAGPTIVRQNIWFGLCPRCWDSVYTQPIFLHAKEQRQARDIAVSPLTIH